MPTVSYASAFDYHYDAGSYGKQPILQVRLMNPHNEKLGVDLDGYLDSGAERSLFDGRLLAAALRLDLFVGKVLAYETTAGAQIEARVHRLRLAHPDLGGFDLDVGLSTVPIRRNLLGRDFFDKIQIGFREHRLVFYISPSP